MADHRALRGPDFTTGPSWQIWSKAPGTKEWEKRAILHAATQAEAEAKARSMFDVPYLKGYQFRADRGLARLSGRRVA